MGCNYGVLYDLTMRLSIFLSHNIATRSPPSTFYIFLSFYLLPMITTVALFFTSLPYVSATTSCGRTHPPTKVLIFHLTKQPLFFFWRPKITFRHIKRDSFTLNI
jgi:hypothetical protein